ncbi:hypothetical protein NMY22_g12746 [Coprinellus aureogranulatus]|nr:hypothetical protein NMY22_g12746 [Coprinellus aureogranulatus]
MRSFGESTARNVQQEIELSAQLSHIQHDSTGHQYDRPKFQCVENTRQTPPYPLPHRSHPAMFKNASNFQAGDIRQINAKTYNERSDPTHVNVADGGQHVFARNIKAEVYHHHEVQGVDPLRELYSHVATRAMHNSEDRADAPKCHPETRKAVQENIFGWISHREEEGAPQQLLWLTGPAGTGKTAIMGTIADELEQNGQLVASFYFAAYTGSIETKSKRQFVTTLAYQLQRHRTFNALISKSMLSTLQADPALTKYNLKSQMDTLILQPFRNASRQETPNSNLPMVILIDGVDECGEDHYADRNRSREKDQIEVLSALLQALCDPTFPCRIIVASRPETWIRRFFTETAASRFTEIFLDNSYNPDKDIELFLKAKFAELSRRYNFAPLTWPREEDIQMLVSNASGQFIYPAVVIRFIDSHGQPPKEQLAIALRATLPKGEANPFAALDALYTAVLNSSPSPSETVLWLKANQRLNTEVLFPPSTWTIHCLFESSEGQAQLLFGLPSLVFPQLKSDTNSSHYGRHMQIPWSSIPNPSWYSAYSFYHKSFLDFLNSPARAGVAFPDVTDERVGQWIWERFHRVWKCAGPEVPIDETLLRTFRFCFMDILWNEFRRTCWNPPILQQEVLSECNPAAWYTGISDVGVEGYRFLRAMFILVHTQCRPYVPCLSGCKRWRKAILKLRADPRSRWPRNALLLDQLCIKRIRYSDL